MVGSCPTSLLPPSLLTKRLCHLLTAQHSCPSRLLPASVGQSRSHALQCTLVAPESPVTSVPLPPSSLPPGLYQAVLFWTSRLPGSASQNPALLQRLSARSICLFLDAFSGHLPPCSSSCDSCGLGLSSRYGRPLGTVVLNTHASPWRREVR